MAFSSNFVNGRSTRVQALAHVGKTGSSTQRTKSVTALINCFYRYNNEKKVLQKSLKPSSFPTDKAITQKDWQRSLHQERELSNPVQTGFRFVEYLNDNPNTTYDELSADAGITKARVCQMIALCKRRLPEITDFLMDTHEPEILKYFTERRLRPLTLLASDEAYNAGIEKHVIDGAHVKIYNPEKTLADCFK